MAASRSVPFFEFSRVTRELRASQLAITRLESQLEKILSERNKFSSEGSILYHRAKEEEQKWKAALKEAEEREQALKSDIVRLLESSEAMERIMLDAEQRVASSEADLITTRKARDEALDEVRELGLRLAGEEEAKREALEMVTALKRDLSSAGEARVEAQNLSIKLDEESKRAEHLETAFRAKRATLNQMIRERNELVEEAIITGETIEKLHADLQNWKDKAEAERSRRDLANRAVKRLAGELISRVRDHFVDMKQSVEALVKEVVDEVQVHFLDHAEVEEVEHGSPAEKLESGGEDCDEDIGVAQPMGTPDPVGYPTDPTPLPAYTPGNPFAPPISMATIFPKNPSMCLCGKVALTFLATWDQTLKHSQDEDHRLAVAQRFEDKLATGRIPCGLCEKALDMKDLYLTVEDDLVGCLECMKLGKTDIPCSIPLKDVTNRKMRSKKGAKKLSKKSLSFAPDAPIMQ